MNAEQKPKTIYYFDEDPGYETLQKITQGYFEVLKLMDGRDMFLNESGMYRLPLNEEASNMFKFKIFGNVAIVGKVQKKWTYLLTRHRKIEQLSMSLNRQLSR